MNRLKQIKKIDTLIDAKLQELERLRELMTKVNVIDYSTDRVQTSHNNDFLTDTIAKIIDLEHKIDEDIDRLVDLKEECMQLLNSLENADHIAVLYKRYFEFKTQQQVADELDLSLRWIQKIEALYMNSEG